MLECGGVRLARAGALVAAAVVGLGIAQSPAFAERPRVAVAPVAGDNASPDVRERVARSLAEGLLASGADVAASPSEAPYVLRGRVAVDGRSYALHLQMIDRRTGKVVASRDDRCEICTSAEAFETASAAASMLKSQVFKAASAPAKAVTAPAASSAVAATAAPPLAPSAPPSAAPSLAVTPASEARAAASGGTHLTAVAATSPAGVQVSRSMPQHRALGWAGVVVGLVGIGAGTALVAIDGQPTCGGPGTCRNLFDTRWGGISSIGVGVVAVGAGILALLGKL